MRTSACLLVCITALGSGCRDWSRFEAAGGSGATGPLTGGGGSGADVPQGGGGAGAGGSGSGGAGGTGGDPVGGTGGSGAMGGGGEAPVGCGFIDALTDSFDGGALDWRWTGGENFTGTSEGNLRFTLPGADTYAEIRSEATYDLRGRTFEMELPDVPSDTGVWFTVGHGYSQYFEFYVDPEFDDLVFWVQLDAGTNDLSESVPYDPIAHRHWRFRGEGDLVHWEASPNGDDWTVLHSRTSLGLFDQRFVDVFIGSHVEDGAPPGARIVDVPEVRGLDPMVPACAAASLTETFDNDGLGPAWSYADYGCAFSEAGDVFTFSCAAGGEGYLESTAFYDLSESKISVELPAESVADAEFVFGVGNPVLGEYAFAVVANDVLELVHDDGMDGYDILDQMPLMAVPRFVRFGASGGLLTVEVSWDDESWAEFLSGPAPFDLSVVRIGNVVWNVSAAPVSVAIDNFNVLP